MSNWNESRKNALTHIKKHLPMCCAEILEWHKTAILPDGEVHYAVKLMIENEYIDYSTALSLVVNACNQFSMEFVIANFDKIESAMLLPILIKLN